MRPLWMLLTLQLLVCAGAWSAPRASATRAEFVRANPCPSTGRARGACPGWEVDHRQPLCAGGADAVANLQWLTVQAHRAKTRGDVRECRRLRRAEPCYPRSK